MGIGKETTGWSLGPHPCSSAGMACVARHIDMLCCLNHSYSAACPQQLYTAVDSAVTSYLTVLSRRFDDGRYQAFREEIQQFISQERVYTDPVRTFAYGTDASFYRLNPKMVVKVHNEAELKKILPIAKRHGVPVTFRAAGTSLSGQALTDSVLLKLSHTGKNFRNFKIHVSISPSQPATASFEQ